MHKYNKIKILRKLFDAVPLWPLGLGGKKNCLQLLSGALAGASNEADSNEMIHCAVSLADWSWQFYPLDGELLPLLRFLQESGADFGPAAELIQALAAKTAPPDGPAHRNNLTEAWTDLLPKLKDRENGASVLPRAWEHCCAALLQGDEGPTQELLAALPAQSGLPRLPALIDRLRVEALLLDADSLTPEALLDHLNAVDESLFGAWKAWQLGLFHLRRGNKKEAALQLSGLMERYFWHPNLTLILHDLTHPLPAPSAQQAPPAILIYSWNKCEALRTTLESLRASGTGAAPIFALDNGSSDGTSDMLRSMKDSWGTKFNLITLPANIGAPAARNWLLSLPEVRARAHVAFLDDDVILPQGWLTELLTVALAKPKAGSVGCLVTDHIPPYGIQAADFHLLSPTEGIRSFNDFEENLFFLCTATGQHDTFAYSHTRPCASVTGCCHLLSMRAVEELGPFDVRFNPSQFDDLERDLRLGRNGWEVYFHGPLAVQHMQHSSLRQAMSIPQQAHIMGNRLKLEHLFTGREIAALRGETRARTEDDLLRKTAILDAALRKNSKA